MLCGPELTRQTDAHDGCLLYDAVHGQVCVEPGNAVQFARRPCMPIFECLEGKPMLIGYRTSKTTNMPGHRPCSILDTSSGAGRVPISSSDCPLESTLVSRCRCSRTRIAMIVAHEHRFLWGGFLLCHAAAKNFGGLMATRFFLVGAPSRYTIW